MKTLRLLFPFVGLLLTHFAFGQWTVLVAGNVDPGEFAFRSSNLANQVQQITQYTQQLQQYAQQIQQLKQTYDLQARLEQLKGDIRSMGPSIMTPANDLLRQERSLLRVPTLDAIQSSANPTRALVTPLRYNVGQGPIGEYFYVGNDIVWRDRTKYTGHEMERLALENQWKAVTELEKIEDAEMQEIANNQQILAHPADESQSQLAQAALDAAKARLESHKMRADRARAEAQNLAQQRELEDKMLEKKKDEEREARRTAAATDAAASLEAQRTFRLSANLLFP